MWEDTLSSAPTCKRDLCEDPIPSSPIISMVRPLISPFHAQGQTVHINLCRKQLQKCGTLFLSGSGSEASIEDVIGKVSFLFFISYSLWPKVCQRKLKKGSVHSRACLVCAGWILELDWGIFFNSDNTCPYIVYPYGDHLWYCLTENGHQFDWKRTQLMENGHQWLKTDTNWLKTDTNCRTWWPFLVRLSQTYPDILQKVRHDYRRTQADPGGLFHFYRGSPFVRLLHFRDNSLRVNAMITISYCQCLISYFPYSPGAEKARLPVTASNLYSDCKRVQPVSSLICVICLVIL